MSALPEVVPGGFVVRLGEGWAGPLHELAGELGGAGRVGMMLSWLEWVEVEVEGFDDRLVEGLHRLRGAVMVATAAVVG